MTAMRLGLHRALRKIRQDLRRAIPRSTGAPGRGQGPVDGPFGGGEFAVGRAAFGSGDPLARADVGHVGEEGES